MLFNSYEFIFFFLPLSFFLYFLLLKYRFVLGAKGFLVFASLFFYSWWNISYLPLILVSMLFNYIVGNTLNENLKWIRSHKKGILVFGIFCNLALLGYFKYADFFLENLNLIAGTSIGLLHLALPLAISFFTFQQIAYLVDSYRGETAEYDFLNYALFVTFFPQLIAGPIVHHKEMMPQFASRWNLVKNYRNIAMGLFVFSLGLFKKVVVADTFAHWATHGFDVASRLGFWEAWITSLSYTFQLYFDFSGYTDMAIGAALLFNIKLPINFDSPYKALDIQDFWRRWHITLSRFLRDYIYIPLGGNRKGEPRTYFNLMITFLLGGIWHGAGWTFVFWGFLHGAALVVLHAWKKYGFRLNSLLAWFLTFNFINIAWVFFRAQNFNDALKVLSGMMGLEGMEKEISISKIMQATEKTSLLDWINIQDASALSPHVVLFVLLFFLVVVFGKNSNQLSAKSSGNGLAYAVGSAVGFVIAIYNLDNASEFLYFNF